MNITKFRKTNKNFHKATFWYSPEVCRTLDDAVEEPTTKLGLDSCLIDVKYIPFDHTTLRDQERIVNSHGERLIYQKNNGYLLYSGSVNHYLEHWFDLWEREEVVYERLSSYPNRMLILTGKENMALLNSILREEFEKRSK